MQEHVALVALIAIAFPANADVSELPRTNNRIEIDGILDDEAWQTALTIELEYETEPAENAKAPVKTIAYLTEDGSNLYLAFDASDPNPDKIRVWLRDRDSIGSGDFVGVSFDTYGDGRRAFEFFANPLGVQLDRTLDDVNNRRDSAWNATWASAGRIGDTGYVVEMKIPLSQIRFQDVDGKQAWGYRLVRRYPRDRDMSFSNMPEDRDRNCRLCQYPRLIGLDGASPSKNLEIVPTLTASQIETSDSPGTSPLLGGRTEVDAGFSLNYGMTPEISLNLAINPDFSQVEADNVRVDINDRFSKSFPERRPFFLEGADYFNTPLQAVFTRSVIDPQLATKITGKRGAHTLAMFVARDEETALLFPGSTGSDTTLLNQANDVFVGRYSRGIGNGSVLGSILTIRDGDDYGNVVAGLDARWRINDRHELTAQFLRSETEYPVAVAEEFDQSLDKFSGRALLFLYSFETRDWFAEFEIEQIDEGFRADTGFMSRADGAEREVSFGRKWQSDADWWTRIRLRGGYEVTERSDGQLLEDKVIIQFTLNGPLQSYLDLSARSGREFDSGQLYAYDRLNVSTSFEPVGGLVFGASAQFGDEVDFGNSRIADHTEFNPFLNWSVNRNLLVRLNSSMVEFETKTGDQIFDARVVDARLTWQFNLSTSIRLTLQQRTIEQNADQYIEPVDGRTEDFGRQLLYAWKMNPQTVFFLGYADAYTENDDLDRLYAAGRSWFMKVGYAWAL